MIATMAAEHSFGKATVPVPGMEDKRRARNNMVLWILAVVLVTAIIVWALNGSDRNRGREDDRMGTPSGAGMAPG